MSLAFAANSGHCSNICSLLTIESFTEKVSEAFLFDLLGFLGVHSFTHLENLVGFPFAVSGRVNL